jgi:hypothetical protein
MKPWWRLSRKIFISYRRADTQETAERLYKHLAQHLGATNVFMDRADIEHGQRWREAVTGQIAAADTFVVLIGQRWLETLRARASDDDVLRTELTSALEQRKEVIPVLVDGATMPATNTLPEELRGLAEYQALPLSGENIELGMLHLLGRVKPGWRLAVAWGFGQLFGWLAGLSILLVALAAFGWMQGEQTFGWTAAAPFLAGALAGAVAGACVAAPQWLVLRPWFARARYLLPTYAVLSAIATGYAASVHGEETGNAVLGLMVLSLPIAFAVMLWWIVSEKLVYAGWWATANFLAPVAALLIAAALGRGATSPIANEGPTAMSDGLSVLGDFFLPMILMSLAAGTMLVWLMRRSEMRRR